MAYANSAYPDQTAPEGAVWSGSALFAINRYFKKQLHKKQNLGKKYGMKFQDIYFKQCSKHLTWINIVHTCLKKQTVQNVESF